MLNIVKGIVSTLSTVNSRLQALETQVARCLPPITSYTPAVMPVMFRSPARTQDDLDAREAEQTNSEAYDVMKSLSRMGGTDVAHTIRHMMSFLIHHDLDVSMNWSGVCNKRAACDLLSMELVQADRRTPTYPAKSFWYMRRWFRNARDRAGGRTKRIPKKTKSKDVELDGD
ncbi:hypothetical protein EG68_12462 [Paragonimus skrjabini miyazakii]|uniref:DUF4806 domain-containing protein n=1 Tax=Paragonimus skrjabini miyazakii TaxID=59628 RepID=A0A8S9YCS6_9TREM|nr:hypothetical protein EG68_12462 [Paragonimus skrjabini miyazakii]